MTVRGTPEVPETTAVVPTIGRSPWLAACLQALRRQADPATLEIVVVDQAVQPLALPPGLADQVLRPERNLGFAGGTNLGLAAARGELLATVNDDALVGPGWLAALTAALRADPRAAAAQGINLLADAAGMEAADAPDGGGSVDEAAFERLALNGSAELKGGQLVGATRVARDGGGGLPRGQEVDQALERIELERIEHGSDRIACNGGGQRIEHLIERIDGCGLGWNRWWQAIQIGHGLPLAAVADSFGFGVTSSATAAGLQRVPPAAAGSPRVPPPATGLAPSHAAADAGAVTEIFGVSATAALFRRTALEQVALGGQIFDPRLVSYYEDAELAGRLRAAGFSALLVPAARVRHNGSASGRTAQSSRERWRLIYGNRYLAAARLLGRGLWPRLPLMLLRDFLDVAGPAALLHAHRRGRQLLPGESSAGPGAGGRLVGMATGWARALRQLPAFARSGPPIPAPAEIARLSRRQHRS